MHHSAPKGKRKTWSGSGALLLAAALAAPAPAPAQTPDYEALWASGETYEQFTAGVTARRSLWERNAARALVPDSLLERARAVAGEWRLLVVAFDRCSDSVSTIPYIAALADSLAGVTLRIIPPERGRPIMEAHPTPDGRPATPTVLLLRDDWRPAGAWVERPSELQAWYIANPGNLSHDARYFEKMEWYEADAGRSTIAEVVALLESAG